MFAGSSQPSKPAFFKGETMIDNNARYIQLGEWIFEVKSIRALRVDAYGKPYNAIANVTLNGDAAYVDGLMTREEDEISREDFQTFYSLCQKLGLKHMQFDRFKNDEAKLSTVEITPLEMETPRLKLVL